MTKNRRRIAIPGLKDETTNYVNVLQYLGAEAVVIEDIRYFLENPGWTEQFDGLLIPGGGDIDPARYGQENTASRDIRPEIDQLQFTALEMADRAGMPILGICNGNQMLNIYFGGDLIQDIENAENHRSHEGISSYHLAEAAEGSYLEHIYGSRFVVNSSHHQAIGRVAREMEVCLRAEDGTIEGIYHKSRPIFGLQWHPERMVPAGKEHPDAVDGSLVYAYFLEHC